MLLTKKQQKEKTKHWPKSESRKSDESKQDYNKRVWGDGVATLMAQSNISNIPAGYDSEGNKI